MSICFDLDKTYDTTRKYGILNNFRFGDFVDRIYTIEIEIKDTTVIDRPSSYLDLHLENDSEGRLRTKFTTKEIISIFPL